MNSKRLLLPLILIILSGCGVKADPVKYPETVVDSYVQSYTGSEPTPEEIERAKTNKAETEALKKDDPLKSPLIPTP